METAIKLAAIAVAAAILAVQLRGMDKGEIALALTLGAGVAILFTIVPVLRDVVGTITYWGEAAGMGDKMMQSMLRVCAVALLTELAAQICKDTGAGALAQKIAFAGKALLLGAALPIFTEVVALFTKVMG